jgi:hypothetical protein
MELADSSVGKTAVDGIDVVVNPDGLVKERGWTVFAENTEDEDESAGSGSGKGGSGLGGKIFAGATGAASTSLTTGLKVGGSVKSRASRFMNDHSGGAVAGNSVGDK